MSYRGSRLLTVLVLTVGWVASRATAAPFDDPSSWAAFDPGDHGVGTDPDGYDGAAFDGRYIYFAPFSQESNEFHGEVLRYDITGTFGSASSWAAYDPGENGVGDNPDMYWGAAFDGRYVYFAPSEHGEVLRYDTQGDFSTALSWATYDPAAHGLGNGHGGYAGALFDGRYVYFTPYKDPAVHGEVLRYDTTASFIIVSSWAAYDPGANGVGSDPQGYRGTPAFDGRYIYFAPWRNSTDFHGEVLRHDTDGDFSSASSWTTYDPGANGVGAHPDGYNGAVFDGRYVYFVPDRVAYSDYHGEVMRYDTAGSFIDVSSWAAYDPGANGLGNNPVAYYGAVFDGLHIYFIPGVNHSEVLRCDTSGDFQNLSSWAAYDPATDGVGVDTGSYRGGVFDGRFVYFVPFGYYDRHGEVLRYDAGVGVPAVSVWGVIVMTLLILTAGAVVLTRRRAAQA